MGALIDALTYTCEFCKTTALPLTISACYLKGKQVVIHECPACGYMRKHGDMGPVGKKNSLKKSAARLKAKKYGPLSRTLLNHNLSRQI